MKRIHEPRMTESERIVWEGSPSHWTVAKDYLKWAAVLAGVIVTAATPYVFFADQLGSEFHLPFAGAMIIAALWPIVMIGWIRFVTKRKVWRLSTERLTVTTGIFSRRTDNLELYRVQDFFLYKPFPLWILGYGYVKVMTTDKTDPEMIIGLVKNPTALYEHLRTNAGKPTSEPPAMSLVVPSALVRKPSLRMIHAASSGSKRSR
jgi:uncharacterized membrane protein YdbT with pleckstrin-like domain